MARRRKFSGPRRAHERAAGGGRLRCLRGLRLRDIRGLAAGGCLLPDGGLSGGSGLAFGHRSAPLELRLYPTILRATIARTIASPWKRPFSMKIRPVSRPDTTDAGHEEAGHVRLERRGVVLGHSVCGSTRTPASTKQRRVRVIAGQQEDRVRGELARGRGRTRPRRCPGRISTTRVSKRAAIAPSLMRFSMSGLIQYFTESRDPRAPVHERDGAPARWSSRAAMAAEFLPPTTTTFFR